MEEMSNEIEYDESYYLRSKRRKLTVAHEEVSKSYEPPPSRKRKNAILHMPTEVLQRILNFMSYNDLSMEEVSNEIEYDESYYLRSKRRRLTVVHEEVTTSYEPPPSRKRKNAILHMPTEVLQRVFNFMSYDDLSTTMRLVNRRFKILAEDILNRSYKRIEYRLKALTKMTLDSIQSSQDDMEIRCLCKLLNFLDIVLFQHSVLMATIWRYVYNRHYRTFRCSMYGGKLLDVHATFMRKLIHHPQQLYSPALIKDYNMPSEVTSIIELTKSFCLHFEKISEEPRNVNMFHCGCKIIDILDCASFAHRDAIYERHSENVFWGKYCYFFSNAWFVAMKIAGDKQLLWCQSQRLMHMRLRRMVLAHTEMFLHQNHFERESMLRLDMLIPPRKPGNSVYTGYGDVHDTFFYYGVMNDGAYLQKFHIEDPEAAEDVDVENEEVFHEAEENPNEDIEESIMYRIPHLGVRLDVTVKCPLTHAPLQYLQSRDQVSPECTCEPREELSVVSGDDFDQHNSPGLVPSTSSAVVPPKVSMKMNFECYGASYPRLPTQYLYSVKHVRE